MSWAAAKMVEAIPKYLVYIEGSTFKAKNCANGTIESAGADAATVINYALTQTGTIILKDGTYPIKTTLDIPSNTALIGASWSAILQHHADLGNNNIVEATTKTNVEVRNLQIDGNDSDHATNSRGVQFTTVTRGTVDNIYVHDTGLDGVRVLTSCSYCQVSNITADNTGNHSIFVGYGCSYCNIVNIRSKDPGTEHVTIEFQTDSTDNTYINIDNVVGEGAENHGLYIQHADYINVANINIFENQNAGIYIDDANHIHFENCIVNQTISAGRQPFEIKSNAANITFDNCTSLNSGSGVSNGALIEGKNITIANSHFSNMDRPLEFGAGCALVEIIGCHFTQYRNGAGGSAVIIKGSGITFDDNTFDNPRNDPAYTLYCNSDGYQISIINNTLNGTASTAQIRTRNQTIIRHNRGWVSENCGTVSGILCSGVVAHGLSYLAGLSIPTLISVTPANSTCGKDDLRASIISGSVNGTGFNVSLVTCSGCVPASGTVYWDAKNWETL